ncbi:membrane protein [Clostridium novyi A str. 4540]|uniref:YidC/Oxa1 family membrane protein insertase n=1 Tax=Clostridium novyi TaxID=1542 RepID=UPI0004D3BFDC|nr:membrane protein insertase YidC [Clostridium novyi]KEH89270.1 membrane protein [Clostridium novyi A str. 4540]
MSFILNLFNYLLSYIYSITGDLGISIIILTLSVRILLLPISIKQKINMVKQQDISQKLQELKTRCKNNNKKLELESAKLYKESSKNMLGCFVSLIQLPIMWALYNIIIKIPMNVGTIVIPWVANIKFSDKYYIIPIIYMLVSLSPSLLSYIKILNGFSKDNNKVSMIIVGLFSTLITIKAPVALGIYFITTGICSFFEEVGFRIYMKNRCFN